MDINKFIDELTNDDINKIRHSKGDAEVRRLLKVKALQLHKTQVSGSVFEDSEGNILQDCDNIILEIIGLGRGEAEIRYNQNGELSVFSKSQGYLPLSQVHDGIVLTKLC